MKTEFTNTFFKSLKRLSFENTWLYKIYEFFRRDLIRFFKNVWFFKKELYRFQPWDYSYNLSIFKRSIEKTLEYIDKNGIEVSSSRMKKVDKMKRVVEILGNIKTDSYIEMAEKEIGPLINNEIVFVPSEGKEDCYELLDNDTPEEREHNKKIFKRSRELEEQEWSELWEIIHGQDYSKFDKNKEWDTQFDGSGLRGWWD
jgi:hypothetical protein